VTHDQDEAMTMSDRIAVMNHGRYEQLGAPQDLYERPDTRFVAGFLGICNLMTGRAEGASGAQGVAVGEYGVARIGDGTALRLPVGQLDGASEVQIGVRPEKIRLLDESAEPGPGLNVLDGRIRDMSYTGASTQYVVDRPDGETVTVYEQNLARAAQDSLHRPGEQVHMVWSPDDTFIVRPPSDRDQDAERHQDKA